MAIFQKAPQYLPYEQHPFSKSAKVHTWLVGVQAFLEQLLLLMQLRPVCAEDRSCAGRTCMFLEHVLLEHMNYSSMSLCSDCSGLLGEERLLILKLLQLSTSLFRFSLSAKIPISAIAKGIC